MQLAHPNGWDSNTNVKRLTVRKGSLGFEINVPSSHEYMLIKTLYCILTHKCHFSCVFLSNGLNANFPLRIVIGVRAIFCQGGAVNHLPKKCLQVAQIFTKQSNRNEGRCNKIGPTGI